MLFRCISFVLCWIACLLTGASNTDSFAKTIQGVFESAVTNIQYNPPTSWLFVKMWRKWRRMILITYVFLLTKPKWMSTNISFPKCIHNGRCLISRYEQSMPLHMQAAQPNQPITQMCANKIKISINIIFMCLLVFIFSTTACMMWYLCWQRQRIKNAQLFFFLKLFLRIVPFSIHTLEF